MREGLSAPEYVRPPINLGSRLATHITTALGGREQFPYGQESLQALVTTCAQLEAVQLDPIDTEHAIDQRYNAVACKSQAARLKAHHTMSRTGNILVEKTGKHGETFHSWQPVDAMSIMDADERLDFYERTIRGTERPLRLTAHPPACTEDAIVARIIAQVETELEPLLETIPAPTYALTTRIRSLARTILRGADTSQPDFGEAPTNERRTIRTINRHASRLVARLEAILAQPEAAAAQAMIEPLEATIETAATSSIDRVVAEHNRDAWTAAPRKGAHIARTATRAAIEPAQLMAAPAPPAEKPADTELAVQELKPVTLALPWLAEGTESRIMEVAVGDHSAYVAWGIEPALAKYAVEMRSQTTRNADGRNRFDDIAVQIAKQRLSVTEDYDIQAGAIKHLRAEQHTPAYADTPIWYYAARGRSNLALRTYLTSGKLRDYLPEHAAPESLDASKPCIVILAETDKKHQIPILKAFTGYSRTRLRVYGAGS